MNAASYDSGTILEVNRSVYPYVLQSETRRQPATLRESASGYGVLRGNNRVTFPMQRTARTAAILRA